jgi:FecR protein
MTWRWRTAGRCGLALLVLCAAPVFAPAQDADPPPRAARLSDAEGAVSLQPAGVQEWTAATLNRPLTTGDRLWSDQNSRAELDLGTAAVRLGSNTGFAFLNLDARSVQMQLSAGALIVTLRDIQNGENYEVDTPNIALSLQQPGVYRVEVNDRGTATAVAVSEGVAQALGSGQTVAVGSQQAVTFTGTDTLAWQSTTLGAPDEFDDWSAGRERAIAESASAGYVASDIPGAQDLDNNGQWQQAPEYGYVWVPTAVVVGWVPYRYGQWLWVTPWGWTWVDDARWGYAPFHYGRWVVWNNRWSWVPTPKHGSPGRAVYAPALVAWVGGPVVGAGAVASGSTVAWFPLGPREAYVPPYRVSSTYMRELNTSSGIGINNNMYISNVEQSNNSTPQRYLNNTPSAVTTVTRNMFTSGQRVGAHTVQIAPAVLASAAVTAAAPPIVPTRQSVLGPGEGRAAVRPPAALMQRTVVAHAAPPPAPAPFERQLSAIEANGGRPPTRGELALLQHAATLTPVRLVGTRAAAAYTPGATERPVSPSLAERARALQQSALPSAPRSNVPALPTTNTSAHVLPGEPLNPASPVLRSDRPPSAQQHPSEAPPRALLPEDAARAVDRPSSIPVYHFPSVEAAPAPAATGGHPQQTNRVAPPPSTPHVATPAPSPAAAHPPPPPHSQSNTEPRESAPHGDRDSRERVLR